MHALHCLLFRSCRVLGGHRQLSPCFFILTKLHTGTCPRMVLLDFLALVRLTYFGIGGSGGKPPSSS
jgi:hypothetical protein